MAAAGREQLQTALGNPAEPNLNDSATRDQAQDSHWSIARQQPAQAMPQSAPHIRPVTAPEQHSSRLCYEAIPASCSPEVARMQSGEACTDMRAQAAPQYPHQVSYSSWRQWAAQLASNPGGAPAHLGTQWHAGQPLSTQGPPGQTAQGRGYMQLPLTSTMGSSAGQQAASVALQQRPEQACAPHSHAFSGQAQHQPTSPGTYFGPTSSAWQRTKSAQQLLATPVAPHPPSGHIRDGALCGAPPAAAWPAAAHPSNTRLQSSNRQQTVPPVIWPATSAGDAL